MLQLRHLNDRMCILVTSHTLLPPPQGSSPGLSRLKEPQMEVSMPLPPSVSMAPSGLAVEGAGLEGGRGLQLAGATTTNCRFLRGMSGPRVPSRGQEGGQAPWKGALRGQGSRGRAASALGVEKTWAREEARGLG